MGAVVAATAKGPYVSPDAVFYVGTARNLLDGRGFAPPPGLPPVGHFPPLFPLLLAAAGRFGLDPLDAARLVNVAALGAVVVLVGWVVRSLTGSGTAGVAAAVLATAAVDLLALSGSALSEPLFLALALAGLVALSAHLDGRRTAGSLLGAAGLAAAALLTRYVGAALVAAGVAALVRFGKGRRWHGILDAGVFGAVAVTPVVGFLAWAGRAPGAAGDRRLAWHAFDLDYVGQAARPLARWILPWPKPPAGLALAVLVVVAAAVVVRRSPPVAAQPRSALPWLLVAFAAAYLATVVANRLLTDATGRLDGRFLAPLHLVAILLVVPVLYRRAGGRPVAALAGVLVVAQVAGAVSWTAGGLTDVGTARRGYTAAAWRTSPVMARVAESDEERVPLYSNAVDAVAFLTGGPAAPVPARKDYLTGRPNPAYAEQLRAMGSELAASGGYLAWFDAATYRRSFLPSRAELERDLPLEVVLRDSVGTLYRVSNR
jgi:4-amino-4-deoxy-L-arabinose transferase-like glycosyltransferase